MESEGLNRFLIESNQLFPACSWSFKVVLCCHCLPLKRTNVLTLGPQKKASQKRLRPTPSWLGQTCRTLASAQLLVIISSSGSRALMMSRLPADFLSEASAPNELQTPSVVRLHPGRLAHQNLHTCPAHIASFIYYYVINICGIFLSQALLF